MDIFDISEEAYEHRVEAVREFTDREDPQEAFERKVRVLSQNKKKSFYVLSYYGIGGIGKTSFVNKLCRVINGDANSPCRLLDEIDCDYIKYDFSAEDSGNDKKCILLSLRNQLGKIDKEFGFYRFDTALMIYGQKIGVDYSRDTKVASVIEESPWLKVTVGAMGLLPVVGTISGILQTIDTLSGAIKEKVNKHINQEKYKAFLESIYEKESSEIMDKLHEYFIEDMRNNMLHVAKRPIVVFLDTFEKYVDSLSMDSVNSTEVKWLRKGNGSVIRSIPGLLWVITGREKLNWSSDDIWDEVSVERPLETMTEEEKEELATRHLEQHLIGDLSEKDASSFLDKAGIRDEILQKQLYKLTSGTPLFLDICVDQYGELLNRGKTPCIDEFGKDYADLMNRYLFNMPSYAREMACFLACVEKWSDDSIEKICNRVSCLTEFKKSRYIDFVTHSFIIKEKTDTYYMHKTVRDAAYHNADDEMKQDVCQAKLSVFEEKMQEDNNILFETIFADYMNTLMSGDVTYEVLCDKGSVVLDGFVKLRTSSEYLLLHRLGEKFADYSKRNYPNTVVDVIAQMVHADTLMNLEEYEKALTVMRTVEKCLLHSDLKQADKIRLLNIKCEILDSNGYYEEAMNLCNSLYEEARVILGELHRETLAALATLGSISWGIKNYEKAIQLCQEAYDKQRESLGERHPDTLCSMYIMAMIYGEMGQKGEQIELLKLVALKEELSEKVSPSMVNTLNSLAMAYKDVGNHGESLQIMQKVTERYEEIFGKNHENTLSSYEWLAYLNGCVGNYDEKLKNRKVVYERRREKQGELHKDTLNALHNVAAAYSSLQNYETALAIMQETFKKKESVCGVLHKDTIETLRFLAYLHEKTGNYKENLRLREEICRRREKMKEEPHFDALPELIDLAYKYKEYDNQVEVLRLYKEIYDRKVKLSGEFSMDTIEWLHSVALAYSKGKDYENAFILMQEVCAKFENSKNVRYESIMYSLMDLISICRKMENKEEETKVVERMLALYRECIEKFGEDDFLVMECLDCLKELNVQVI